MSDKKPDAAPAAAAPEEKAAPKKGLPIKMIAVVLAVMIAEAGAIVGFLHFAAPPPIVADPGEIHLENDESEQTREIEIVSDKFQNMQTGATWIVNLGVFIQVKNRNVNGVNKILESKRNEVIEGINQIISRSQINQLKEPTRQTLNRQVTDFLATILVGVEGAPGEMPLDDAKKAAGADHGGGGGHGEAESGHGETTDHAAGGHDAAQGHDSDKPADKVRLFERVLIPKCELYAVDM